MGKMNKRVSKKGGDNMDSKKADWSLISPLFKTFEQCQREGEEYVDKMAKDEIIDKLVELLDAYEGGTATISNQGQAMDGYSALANFVSIAKRAKELKIAASER